jgi:hypothetical protein
MCDNSNTDTDGFGTAELRDTEPEDDLSHAERNAKQLEMLEESADE